jgi:hypothetical protein
MISEIQMLTDFDSSAPDEVSAVSAVRYDDRIKLSWTNPTDIDFAATNIYRNGLFIASVRDFSGSYLDAGL